MPIDSTAIPRSIETDGERRDVVPRDWTSGFYPGVLWQLYGFSKNDSLRNAAEQWTAFEEGQKYDDHTHDLGFKVYCSFGEGYKITKNENYKDIIVRASEQLIQRYNPTVGAIRSWDFNADEWDFPVIIDNMMNLEMLFEATRMSGDSIFHEIAYQHAETTLENHFRDDFSSYHVVDYNPETGAVNQKTTHQGNAAESSWSRGQAWGLYGYTMAYRYTKDERFLKRAEQIANFMFAHPNMPADLVPYWDFDAPNIPDEPRDASAAAVAVSGLLELQKYSPANAEKYLEWADTSLATLATPDYQSSVRPFLLDHSTGSAPSNSEVDVPLIYADYYYVEALLRRRALSK